LIKMQKQITV